MPNQSAICRISPLTATHLVIVGITLIHLLFAPWPKLGVDEAHYALYGLHPAWSYFDHPPLVGWLQSVALLLGESEFILRLWPIILFAATSYVLFFLCRRLFPLVSAWLGFISVLLLQGALILQLLGTAMTPEMPLLLLSLGIVWLYYNAFNDNRWRDWLLLGLCLGLAGLTKYTAIVFVCSILLMLVINRRWALFYSAKLWCCAAIALLLISPVIWWNYQHDWISLLYQLRRTHEVSHWQWLALVKMQLEQLLLYSPVLYIGSLAAFSHYWLARKVKKIDQATLVLLIFALPILLLFSWTTLTANNKFLPHWTSTGWLLLIPLVARWLMEQWQNKTVRFLAYSSGNYSCLLLVLFYSLMMLKPVNLIPPLKLGLRDLVGWQQAAQQGRALLGQLSSQPGPGPSTLLVPNWTDASRIAWYARPLPVQVLDPSKKITQFSLWFGQPSRATNGILIMPRKKDKRATPNYTLGQCQWLTSKTIKVKQVTINAFDFYHCFPNPAKAQSSHSASTTKRRQPL